MSHAGNPCTLCSEMRSGICRMLADWSLDAFQNAVHSVFLCKRQMVRPALLQGHGIALVARGTAKLSALSASGSETLLGFVSAGEVGNIHSDAHQSIFITALEDTRLCSMDAGVMTGMGAAGFQVLELIQQRTFLELAKARLRMQLLDIPDAHERVAAFILAEMNSGRWRVAADEIQLPCTRNDIAAYLYLAPETVSRAFTDLRSRNMISGRTPSQIRVVANGDWKRVREQVCF